MSYYLDKVVWITGASSGIGEEMAKQVAKQGACVVLSSRNLAALEQVKESLDNASRHLCLPLDLEHADNFKELAQLIVDRYGRIDILINNGGLSQRSTVAESRLEIDRKIMEINYFGNIALTKAVLPFMIRQKSGHIVVISSIAGKFGFFLRSAYSASKHALFGFYESLLLEEEANGISVSMICPGKINTNISLNALNKHGESHGVMDHNQSEGMSAEVCAKKIVRAVSKKKVEVLIGNKEILAVFIKRFFPGLFWKIIKRQHAT